LLLRGQGARVEKGLPVRLMHGSMISIAGPDTKKLWKKLPAPDAGAFVFIFEHHSPKPAVVAAAAAAVPSPSFAAGLGLGIVDPTKQVGSS
jgi:hypothetical protein